METILKPPWTLYVIVIITVLGFALLVGVLLSAASDRRELAQAVCYPYVLDVLLDTADVGYVAVCADGHWVELETGAPEAPETPLKSCRQ